MTLSLRVNHLALSAGSVKSVSKTAVAFSFSCNVVWPSAGNPVSIASINEPIRRYLLSIVLPKPFFSIKTDQEVRRVGLSPNPAGMCAL
jgi:hypothetical protein